VRPLRHDYLLWDLKKLAALQNNGQALEQPPKQQRAQSDMDRSGDMIVILA